MGIDRGRKISTTTGKGRRPGSAEVDRNRGPVGRSGPTSAALSVGESERAVGRAEHIEAAESAANEARTRATKPGPPMRVNRARVKHAPPWRRCARSEAKRDLGIHAARRREIELRVADVALAHDM